MSNLKCDLEGVPFLVQNIKYNCGLMKFDITFFNGVKKAISYEWLVPSMELFQLQPTKEQWVNAWWWVNELSPQLWKEWFINES